MDASSRSGLGARLGGHVGVVNSRNELAGFRELVLVFRELSPAISTTGARWRCSLPSAVMRWASLHGLRIGKLPLYLTGAVERVGEAVTETQVSGVAAAASRVLVAYF